MSSVCPFVDRSAEIEALDRAWARRPGLVVVYGRRRVGKTRMMVEWVKKRRLKSVYYLAHLASHEYNLARMAEAASKQLGDPLLARLKPSTLGDLLELVARKGDVVVVIDEFTYWARSSSRVLSELQEYVDHRLTSTRLLVVVTGSLVGVMENNVLGGGAPLYGRASTRIKLEPLKYIYVRQIVSRMPPEDRIRLYALVGGIPYYLCLVRGKKRVGEAVEELITSPGAPLLTEKDLLLREEFRDPHTYNAILSALAKGYDTPAKIAQVTGIDSSHTSKYLHVLEHLGIVRREAPLFRKKGRYKIVDPILRTWYTLIEPVIDLLETEAYNEAHKAIMKRIDNYTAMAWEEIVRDYLLQVYAEKGYTVAGRLEHKGEEVDIALLNTEEKKAILAEAKWSTLTLEEAHSLRRQTEKKALRLLPGDYTVEEIVVAAKSITEAPKLSWAITLDTIESTWETRPLVEE